MTEEEQRGKRLEQIAKHYRIKQITLAQRIGVSRGFVSRMMSGKEDITGKVIKKLSELYPLLNMNWLLKGEGEMFSEKQKPVDEVAEPGLRYSTDPLSALRQLLEEHERRIAALEEEVRKMKGE